MRGNWGPQVLNEFSKWQKDRSFCPIQGPKYVGLGFIDLPKWPGHKTIWEPLFWKVRVLSCVEDSQTGEHLWPSLFLSLPHYLWLSTGNTLLSIMWERQWWQREQFLSFCSAGGSPTDSVPGETHSWPKKTQKECFTVDPHSLATSRKVKSAESLGISE